MRKIINFILLFTLGLFLTSCTNNQNDPITEPKTLTIMTPGGAPTLSQVLIAHDAQSEDYLVGGCKVEVTVGSGAQAVQAAITSQSHDIVVAPINLGATLYSKNQSYKYVANVTDGNLYLASTEDFSLSDLSSKKLVFFGQGTINQAVLDEIFEVNNITLSSDLTYLGDTSLTNAQLVADQEPGTIYLVAEPVLSAARANLTKADKTLYTIDIQEEFSKASNGLTFLQAGVFVKKDLDKYIVDAYLEALEDSIDFVNEHPDTASQYATELEFGLPAAAVLTNAIPGCNLNFRLATDCKDSLNALVELNPSLFGGSISDDFYF